MIAPKIPSNEAERLNALREYHILDTEPEIAFDEITKFAALVCQAPISMVSFIDKDRQWIKSNYGLDVKETPREISMCAHIITNSNEITEVEDASKDERFHNNPMTVEGPEVKFYAGSPLVDSKGFCLGSLCVADNQPKKLDQNQKEMLAFLSKQVTTQLELRKKNTELKKANDRIKNDQKKLNDIVAHIGDIIYELNDQGKFIYVNPAIQKISGYSEDALLKSHFWELAAPGTENALGAHYLRIIKGGVTSDYYEFQMKTKTGSIWVGQNVEIEYEGKRAVHVYAVARDIDDLVKTREELRENSEKYRLLSENSKDVISLHDREGNNTFLSPSVEKLLGYKPGEIEGERVYKMIHSEDVENVIKQASEDLMARRDLRKVECRIARKDGSYIWVEGNFQRVKDKSGRTIGFQASTRDITKRKEKEFELTKNNAKLQALIENTNDAICVIDKYQDNFRFVSFNRGSQSQISYLIGFQPKEGALLNFDLIHEKLPAFETLLERAFAGERLNETFSFGQDGLTWYLDCHFNPIYDSEKEIFGLALQIRDVSEKMRVNEQSDKHRYNLELLNEIVANSVISDEEQIQSILNVSLKYLDMELGIVSHINGTDYKVIHSLSEQTAMDILPDSVYELKNTFCQQTYQEITTLTINKTNEAQYKWHPCYTDLNLRSYIGCPYFVSGEIRGTLNFSSQQSKYDPFDSNQIGFVNLLARWVGFLIERAEHRDSLAKERDVLKAFVLSAPAAIAMFNEKAEYLAVSKKWLSDYDLEEGQLIGRGHFDVFPESAKAWKPIIDNVLKGSTEKQDIYELKRPDKKEQWIKWEMQPWHAQGGQIGGAIFITEDITIQVEQKKELEQAELDLKQSEQRYRLLSENSRDIVSLTDQKGNYKFLSSAVKEMLGYDYKELIGVNAFDITHPDDASRMRNDKTGLDKIDSSAGTFITRIRKKNNEYLWMESTIRAIRNEEAKIEGYQVSSRDISQRNAHEQNIIQNQAKIEALIENTEDAICVIDKQNQFLSFNDTFKKHLEFFNGFTPKVGEVFDLESLNTQSPGFKLSVNRAMQNNKFSVLQSFEKEGRRFYFDCYYNPVTDQDSQIFGLTIRIQDVTEKTERTIKSELFRKSTQKLNELFAQTEFSLFEQVNQALIIAQEYFDFDVAALSTIHKEDYVVDYCSLKSKNLPIKARDRFKLKDMYCNDVYKKSIYQTIDESNEDNYKKHYSRQQLRLKSYIGSPYYVNNQKRGTVWLGSLQSRPQVFGDQEIEFINMLSRSLGFLIERHEYRDQLIAEQVVLKAFVFSAPACIAMLNEKLEYVAVSKKWKHEYDLNQHEILGQYYGDLSPHLKKPWDHILKECLQGRVEKNDCFRNYKADGSEQWLKWEIRPWVLSKDNTGGIIMYTEDITNQIHQQEELKRAIHIAENASKSKEQFLSTMSHEIRTPMNAILGAANLLFQGNPKPEQLDNLNLLKFSGDNLLSLINDILDFNKIEAGKIDFEEIDFNLKDLLTGIKQSLKFKAEEKGVDLILKYDDQLPEVFIGDSVRVSQILNNLISNAIKFTEEGYVKIEVIGNGETGRKTTLSFRIQDTGVGIAREDRNRIFEDFSQASEDITRKYGGTGLGLAITKRLLELMGSTIKVASKKGKGTVFYFDLDFVPGNQLRNEISVPPMNGQNKTTGQESINVLIAEDNEANRKIIAQFLSSWNVNSDFAVNGEEVVEKIKKGTYDLVFMDLRMPEMDGYEATSIIRKMPEAYYKEIPIIALTASATIDIREKTKDLGMNDFITKPFNPDEVYNKIVKYVPRYAVNVKNEVKNMAPYDPDSTLEEAFPYLYQISDGNEEMITDIIRSVADTMPTELSKLESLVTQKNFDLFAEIIHKIKPNLTSLELSALVDLADELEIAAENENEVKINNNLPMFLDSIKTEISTIEENYFK